MRGNSLANRSRHGCIGGAKTSIIERSFNNNDSFMTTPRSHYERASARDNVLSWSLGGLVIYGVLMLITAQGLPDMGSWKFGAAALLLFAHAAGFYMRRRVAWTFSVTLFAVTGTLLVVLGAAGFIWGGLRIASGPHGEGFGALGEAIATGAGVLIGPVALLLGLTSLWLARGLLRARDSFGGASTGAGWPVSVIGALASFAFLIWIGNDYFRGDIARQIDCAENRIEACAQLASNSGIKKADLKAFAAKACQGNVKAGCQRLTPAETAAVTVVCRDGDLDICTALATRLLTDGNVSMARSHFDFACTYAARSCLIASEVLRKNGKPDLAREMESKACKRDRGPICSAMLEWPDLTDRARSEIERRACRDGDIPACTRMIDRDHAGSCNYLCSMSMKRHVVDEHASLMCFKCAQRAAAVGDAERSKVWMEFACKGGQELACKQAGAPTRSLLDSSSVAQLSGSQRKSLLQRLAELIPGCGRVADLEFRGNDLVVIGLASDTDCVSSGLRALSDARAQPELLEIQRDGDKVRFKALVKAAALLTR